MINNDVLRRIRYIFDISDAKMMSLASSVDNKVTRSQISDWLKKDDDPAQQICSDLQLATFLNNFIDEKRGKQEGVQRTPEKKLSNNLIFMKLKIAINLQAEDILAILALANFKLSKHELSAFFRKSGHKHYRECKDQVLRNFLQGLQFKLRPTDSKVKPAKENKTKKNETPVKKETSKSTYKWKKLDPSN